MIRRGGPRDGDVMGWGVVDRVPDDPSGAITFSAFETREEAEAAAAERRGS